MYVYQEPAGEAIIKHAEWLQLIKTAGDKEARKAAIKQIRKSEKTKRVGGYLHEAKYASYKMKLRRHQG